MQENTATHIGYYLHKDGSPVVADIKELDKIKKDYRFYKMLYSNEDITKFLSTYNAGYDKKRISIKPFFPIN